MRALNGRESTLSNWLDNESEKFREMRVLAGPTLKTVNPPIDNGSKPPTSNKSKQAVLIEKPMRKYPTSKSKQTVLIEKPMRKYQTYRNCTPLR